MAIELNKNASKHLYEFIKVDIGFSLVMTFNKSLGLNYLDLFLGDDVVTLYFNENNILSLLIDGESVPIFNKKGFELFTQALYDTWKKDNENHAVNVFIDRLRDFDIDITRFDEPTYKSDVLNKAFSHEEWTKHMFVDKTENIFSLDNVKEFNNVKNKSGAQTFMVKSERGQAMGVVQPHPFLPPDTIVIPQVLAKDILVDIGKNDLLSKYATDSQKSKLIKLITIRVDAFENEPFKKGSKTIVINNKRYYKILVDRVTYDNEKLTLYDKYGNVVEIHKSKDELLRMLGPAARQILDNEEVVYTRFPGLFGGSYTLRKIIINRDPTSSAIYMNPLLCKPFNADFDGDTMRIFFSLNNHDKVHVFYEEDGKIKIKKVNSQKIKYAVLSHEANYAYMSELAQQTGLIFDVINKSTKDKYVKNRLIHQVKHTRPLFVSKQLTSSIFTIMSMLYRKNDQSFKNDFDEICSKYNITDEDKANIISILKKSKFSQDDFVTLKDIIINKYNVNLSDLFSNPMTVVDTTTLDDVLQSNVITRNIIDKIQVNVYKNILNDKGIDIYKILKDVFSLLAKNKNDNLGIIRFDNEIRKVEFEGITNEELFNEIQNFLEYMDKSIDNVKQVVNKESKGQTDALVKQILNYVNK